MAIEVVQRVLLTDRMQEQVVLMDDYGNQSHIYINVLGNVDRASLLAEQISAMGQRQADLESYAEANGHDLRQQKIVGSARRSSLMKANGVLALAASGVKQVASSVTPAAAKIV